MASRTPRGRSEVLGRALRLLGLVLLAAVAVVRSEARAQGNDASQVYVTPFPEKDSYRLYVFGDSLADGLAAGLADAFRGEQGLEVFKKAKAGSGFARPQTYDWLAAAKETVANERFHIAVIVIGVAERHPIQADRKRLLPGSDEWKLEYGKRVDDFIKAIRKSQAAIYWVGLPIMRSAEASAHMQMINAVFREKVFLNGAKFIDTWGGFDDENGQYSQYGPDVSGKVRLLRDNDGVHFTKDGYRKLAHFVEREVRRDMAIAKAERNIPLAGGEAEQRRVLAGRPAPQPVASTDTPSASPSVRTFASPGARASAAPQDARPEPEPDLARLEQKADHARVAVSLSEGGRAESMSLEIVRPPIPAQVVAHVAGRSSQAKGVQAQEATTRAVVGGLTLMSSVTMAGDASSGGRRAGASVQALSYRVMVKGETIPPKPGRADDFRWPRVERKAGGS